MSFLLVKRNYFTINTLLNLCTDNRRAGELMERLNQVSHTIMSHKVSEKLLPPESAGAASSSAFVVDDQPDSTTVCGYGRCAHVHSYHTHTHMHTDAHPLGCNDFTPLKHCCLSCPYKRWHSPSYTRPAVHRRQHKNVVSV
jgi:hypothetical protein